MTTKRASAEEKVEADHKEPEAPEEQELAPESDSEEPDSDLQKHLDELEELIHESPLVAVGVAAGLGLVVGLLLSRR